MAVLKNDPAILDMEMKTGDTYVAEFIYTEEGKIGVNQETGADIIDDIPVNLKNMNVTGQARLQPNNAEGFNLVINVFDQDEVNAEGELINVGKFQIMFTADFTRQFGSDKRSKVYAYDVQAEDVEKNVHTFMEGKITFKPDITRAELPINLPLP